ncbi:MAG TPA: UvrD-helicase domain-containing protein [Acidobacteriaceae bacterium]|nr:UvrD-helicase domain-containing protein [Acidobacteriaceae bacterium]
MTSNSDWNFLPVDGSRANERSGAAAQADSAARADAWNVEQSWIVEAPAGSGKTELLMQRFLRLLARVEVPEQVLAITFTRKAAAEMRDRILESLRDAEKGTPIDPQASHKSQTRRFALEALATNAARNWELTRQPQRLNIRTIDSLCREIASRLPLLSRLGVHLQPVDDASELHRTAAQAAIQEMGGVDPRLQHAARTLLLHLNNDMGRAIDLLAEMLSTRDQWGRVFPIERERSDEEMNALISERFEKPLQQKVLQTLQELFQRVSPDQWRTVFQLANYAATQLENSTGSNPFRDLLHSADVPDCCCEELTKWQAAARLLLTKEGEPRKPGGIDKRIGFQGNSPEKLKLQNLLTSLLGNDIFVENLRGVAALPTPCYDARQRQVLCASFLLLRRALAHLRLAFATVGKIDFIEISLAAAHALDENYSSLTLAFGTAIQHLLVDEMQDTSTTHFDLLARLVHGWDGRSQTVFLVGDPKQSIYRFRRVEVGLFARAQREGLGGVSLQSIRLSSNFRSCQSLVQQNNLAFQQIFTRALRSEPSLEQAGHAHPDEVLFEPSHAAHREEEIQRIFWHARIHPYKPVSRKGHLTSSKDEAGESETAAQDDCAAEVREICEVIERHRAAATAGCKPASVAVLIRARTHVGPILEAMRERRIPYRAIDLDTLPDRQPVLDALALTRCLLHPADRVSSLAVLRAPWCGLTLADLHLLCGSDHPGSNGRPLGSAVQERLSLLSSDGQRRLRRVWDIVEAARLQIAHNRLSTTIERAWHSLGGQDCVPPVERTGVQEFFRMLARMENESGIPDVAQIEEKMKKLAAPTPETDGNPVEVLTLFKAKGLEWDVVLIPGLHRQPPNDAPRLVYWLEQPSTHSSQGRDGEADILLAPVKHTAEDKERINSWIQSLSAERDRAELKRLFYVGCTRARQELHLFAECRENKDGGLTKAHAKSLLHTAWPVASTFFEQFRSGKTTDGSSRSNVIAMPSQTRRSGEPLPAVIPAIAAEIGNPGQAATIRLSNFYRLASGWQPQTPAADVSFVPATATRELERERTVFSRPQASWRKRSVGIVIHALLEPVAHILRRAPSQAHAEHAIKDLEQRAFVQLLQAGLRRQDAAQEAKHIQHLLQAVSTDADARWLFAAHPLPAGIDAEFEVPLTALHHGEVRSIRLDRMFLAGRRPYATGHDCLWIVDFKTASLGQRNKDEFLAQERELYVEQLQTYGEILRAMYPGYAEIYLGLYYPLLPHFAWWSYPGEPAAVPDCN